MLKILHSKTFEHFFIILKRTIFSSWSVPKSAKNAQNSAAARRGKRTKPSSLGFFIYRRPECAVGALVVDER